MTEIDGAPIAIERDVLQAARERSEATGKTLGKVVSDMMRDSLTAPDSDPVYRNGIKLLPKRKVVRKVNVEDINALLNEPE